MYLIVDAIRLSDLERMDTTATTAAEAREKAEAMAQKYGVTVTVMAPAGVCEGGIVSHWSRSLPADAPVPFGWMGGGAP